MKELLAHSQWRYSIISTELLPNEIQEEEDIDRKVANLNFQCSQTGMSKYVDSNGNRVNAGNFDSDGFNVNNDPDNNCNPNIAGGAVWQFLLTASTTFSTG